MSKIFDRDNIAAARMNIAAQGTPPVVRWAWVGAAIMAFIFYVFATWFITGKAVPTNPGPDPLPEITRQFIFWIQIVVTVISLYLIWYFVIAPWRRDGQMNTTGMLYLSWLSLFFQDPMMSYTSCTLFYNSYMVNLGTWTLGSTPGWSSPNGNNLPEPLLLIIGGYTIIGYSLIFPVLAVLNKLRERWPGLSKFRLAIIGILILIVLDTIFESLLLRTGVYAYPYGIREITLFAGETYQFPMSEGLHYGGLTIGSTLMLLLYRDDKGQTFVERGIDKLKLGAFQRQWVKFLALFGFVHASMFLVFTIPMQWYGMHSDPFPKGYPSYMVNGLCAYGPNQDQCPGPGVMMPRPINNPF
jgi:Spirocyclase AveC-like